MLFKILCYYFFMINNQKKILYLITKANWGGAQKYVFDLASEIKDYEVVFAYGKPFGGLSKKLKTAGIRTIEINNLGRDVNLFSEFKVIRTLWKILRKERPDIVHLNSPKIGGLGGLLGRLIGIEKIIYTAHGWTFNEDRNWLSKIIIKFLSWLTIILSHHTIVIAQTEYDQVIHWPFVTKNKLRLIYNGIQPIDFLTRQEARQKLSTKIKENDMVIGTISELHKNKGLKYAIKGFKKISEKYENLKFIIIGEGEDRKYLEEKIKKHHLENKVFLIGNIENASQYLKVFDIFLLSSLKEGLPFVLLEAGLAKLPVVATKVGGISEIIENNLSGILIKEKDESEIEKALEPLITDKEKREKFGENLNTTIKEKFSFDKMFRATEKLYQ